MDLFFALIPANSNHVYFVKILMCSNTCFLSLRLRLLLHIGRILKKSTTQLLSIVNCTCVSVSSVVSASLLFAVVLAGSEESEPGGACSSSAVCHWQVCLSIDLLSYLHYNKVFLSVSVPGFLTAALPT